MKRSSRMVAARRVMAVAASGVMVFAATPSAAELPAPDERLKIVADLDDDDANGEPDVEQAVVPSASRLRAVTLDRDAVAPSAFSGIRILREDRPLGPGADVRAQDVVRIQAARAGRFEWAGRRLHVIEVRAMDQAGGIIDLARSHASLTRSSPARLAHPQPDGGDLRILVRGVAEDLPASVHLTSRAEAGPILDTLRDVALQEVPCPSGLGESAANESVMAEPGGLLCAASVPIRAVADDVDRSHPLAQRRSLRAELGGALVVQGEGGQTLQTIRVGGPRGFALQRTRARLRVHVIRTTPGGALPVGATVEEALEIARREVSRANAMWGACGISFGPEAELDVRIVDPPPPHLLAVGCDHGVRASGGTVRFRAAGRSFAVTIQQGDSPAQAARRVAEVLSAAGFSATVSDNPPISAGALGSSDVLVKERDGRAAAIVGPTEGAVSDDASLPVCIGRVDLREGLHHFSDADAITGTLAERSLIKAFDDGDPATIEVFLVASFHGGARIGESFIQGERGAIQNVVIEDRGAVRADVASSALAHELGHILLDSPGHPDDFSADTPTQLMDADAMDPSAFGPRRLTSSECARAVRQGLGPRSSGMLTPWPLTPIP